MAEGAGGPGLLLEALQAVLVGGQLLGDDLDGHVAAEARVVGAVDLAHAARAERRDDLVRADTTARDQRQVGGLSPGLCAQPRPLSRPKPGTPLTGALTATRGAAPPPPCDQSSDSAEKPRGCDLASSPLLSYLAVVWMLAWPAILWTVAMAAPRSRRSEMKERRRSPTASQPLRRRRTTPRP